MKATSRTGWASVLMKNSDYGLEFDPQGRLSTSIYNGSTWDGYIYYAGITTGQWHHIAMVWDEVGNDLFLYVDGVMVGSDTNRGNHSANNNVLRLGAWTTGSEFFNGLLDEIRISNFVRYTSSFTPPTTLLEADSGTVALWHLDEGSGQTVNDSSGHGWNGVLGSSTSVQSSDPAWSSDSPVISSTNKPPVLFNDDIVTDEDTAITFDALSNDTDPDGDTLSIASVTQGSHGTVLINADGTIKYTPAANFHGTDSFTYTAADGKGGTSTASVNVIVNSINDIPVANDLALTMVEDSPIGVMLTANDIDGDTLTFTITSQPGGGTLSGTAPDLTYTPDTGYKGTDHFTFKVNDGQVDSNVATVTITVNAVNHIPIAENDTYAVNEDEVLTVASPGILSNDSDGDNDPLTVVKVSDPAHGSLVLNSNGSFTYTPNANFNGNDSFTYKANDNQADSGIATVSITVNPVNDPPAAVNDAYSTNQGTTLTVNAPGVLGNDSDIEGSGLTAVLATDASHGVLTLNPNGGFTYIPTGGYSGTDTFTYRANDGQLASNIATVTIQVNAQATPSGSSLSFGGNDYVTFGDLDLTGSFTIEFWMKANSRTGWASVLMKNSDYGLEFDPQGRLSTSIYNGSTWDGYIYYDGITTGQWHHIAMVWDEVGNDLYLYVDGVMVGSDTNRGNHSANNNVLRLGAWTTRSEFFTGLIDEVRISNFVRYTSNFTPPTTLLQSDSGTVALWHLDEGSGQRVNDSSGHGWNGVLGSSTSVQSSDPAWSSDTPIK
jgi:VCBS repeat-containing protein